MESKQKQFVDHNDEKIISQDKLSSQGQNNLSMLVDNKHNLIQFNLLKGTVRADTTTNKHFIISHGKLTIALLVFIMILRLLPSPLIINVVQNDPYQFNKEQCSDDQCSQYSQGYETIILKKVNPLHRQLKFFVRLNNQNIKNFQQITGINRVDISQQITYAQIYASRENGIYGEVIQQVDGSQTYEIIFNGEPLIYIGKIYILDEASYLLKIYKLIHKYKKQVKRRLQGIYNQGNQQSLGNSQQDNKTSINSDEQANKNNNIKISNQTGLIDNRTDAKVQEQNNVTNETNIDNKQKQQTKIQQKQISVPLSIHLVRYSQFFTAFELIVRYVTLLYILYVRAQTKDSPMIFHLILVATSNPLIFTEIAFPNNASKIISLICDSMYIFYIALFLDFTHRKLRNDKLDIFIRILKLILTISLYILNILRQTYFGNNSTFLSILQYIIFFIVFIPIFQYLWRIYFIKSRTILHRNLMFISLTVYYCLLLFFSSYLVLYGWKKISMHLIIQMYGVKLCYLTSPIKRQLNLNQEIRMIQSQNQPINSQKKQNIINSGKQQLNDQSESNERNEKQSEDYLNNEFVEIKQHYR